MNMTVKNFDLQLFAEDAVPVSESVDVSEAQATDSSDVQAGEAVSAKLQEAGTNASDTDTNTRLPFSEIRKLYKEDFKEYRKGIIEKRFREESGARRDLEALAPIIERAAQKYGLDPGNIKGIAEAVAADKSYYAELAEKNGTTPEIEERLDVSQREAAMAKAEIARRDEEKRREEMLTRINDQVRETQAVYPDFDLDAEMANAAAINDYINRGKFEYDAAKDPLYQQYKDSYTRSGKLAMRDTAAQAAALTGGYGNSYAQSAGQQAYNAYMQQLNNKIPELWQLAYGKYNQEGQDMLSRIGVLGDADDKDYGRRTDAWNRALSEYSMYNELYGNERNFGYTAEQDAIAADLAERRFRYEQEQNAAALEYQKQRDAVADSQWERNYALSLAAKGGSSGGEDNVNLFTYAGTDTKNDDYNIYYDSNGKQYSVARGVNPYTGTKNADTKNGTFSNGYQPNNIGGSKLTKTGLTDVVNGRTQNVWVDEDGRAWIWDGTQNSYQKYMVNGSWMKGTKLNNLLKRQS